MSLLARRQRRSLQNTEQRLAVRCGVARESLEQSIANTGITSLQDQVEIFAGFIFRNIGWEPSNYCFAGRRRQVRHPGKQLLSVAIRPITKDSAERLRQRSGNKLNIHSAINRGEVVLSGASLMTNGLLLRAIPSSAA